MTGPEPDGIVWHTSSYSSHGGACVEVGWRASSYSGTAGNCVEVGWRTSSYSHGGAACVEVAPAPDTVQVRDSKDRTGPTLTVPTAVWRAFLTTVTC